MTVNMRKEDEMRGGEESLFAIMAASVLWPAVALAEEPAKAAGKYGGSDYLWFGMIGLILVYGVYDTFFKTP